MTDRDPTRTGATDRAEKVALYGRLVEQTMAPAGGLWTDGATAVELAPGTAWEHDAVGRALAFWRDLVGGTEADR